MKIDLSENLVDIDKLVTFFNVPISEIQNWLDEQIIPPETYIKVGGIYRFQLSAVVDAIQNQIKPSDNEDIRVAVKTIKKEEKVSSNKSNDFEKLEIASENGNLDATFKLAQSHEIGNGTEINLEEAFNNYQICALHGNKDAQIELSRCFDQGIGTDINRVEAKRLYDLASKKEIIFKSVLKRTSKDINIEKTSKNYLIEVNIVGMKHRSKLTSDILKSLEKYTINLKTEQTNIYDKKAVQCIAFTENDDPIHIGYIEKKKSSIVSELISSYLSYKVKIIKISNHKISCEIAFLNFTSENIEKNNLDLSEEFTKGNYFYLNEDFEDALECFIECYNNNYDPFLEITKTPPYIGRSEYTRQSLAYQAMRRVGGSSIQEIMIASGIQTAQRVRSMISEQIRPRLEKEFGRNILITHTQQSYQHKYGSSDGKHNLSGYEIPQNIEKSNGELLYKIGDCYYNAEKKNEAFNFFFKSSSFYSADAEYMLGECYYWGSGTKENWSEAYKFFMLSANQHNQYAQYMIGFMYFYGNFVELNRKKAYSFLKLSALQGHDYASKLLEQNYISEIE